MPGKGLLVVGSLSFLGTILVVVAGRDEGESVEVGWIQHGLSWMIDG